MKHTDGRTDEEKDIASYCTSILCTLCEECIRKRTQQH